MLIKDVLKEFVFDCEVRKISKRTTRTYRTNCDLFFVYLEREFGATELEEVNRQHIKIYR